MKTRPEKLKTISLPMYDSEEDAKILRYIRITIANNKDMNTSTAVIKKALLESIDKCAENKLKAIKEILDTTCVPVIEKEKGD